jgi:ParB family transcriptional regulator, chromosome partitioning protein
MQQQTVTADFRTLAIDQLRESPTNPRRSFDQAKLQELAQSIRAQGVLVPLIVRNLAADQFEVVAGARRFRAAQAAELFAVPVRVVELTDDEALTLQLVENAQREDVHPLEEAFAYRALLDMPEPKYDVSSIALKVGKSIGHVYGRLRYVDLIEPAAQAFLENRLTAGHALLIARLPQSQQAQALEAAFRSHWGSTEKQVIPVRELAQWIRQNLMLQLEDVIFDREDETLMSEAGSCVSCQKRTGFNTALFDDFPNDDRCLDSGCYEAKVSAWLKRQTEQNPALVQISEYYGPQRDKPIIPRSQYVEIKPTENSEEPEKPNQVLCESAATGIVVEGNQVGRTVQICANAECPIHHAPQQQAREEREEEYERVLAERRKNLAQNRELLDSVLSKVPAVLGRPDHEMMIAAWMESLDYEDFERLCERHQIPYEETHLEEDIRELFRQYLSKLADTDVSRFLMELALLPSGYSSNKLEETDRLLVAAKLYDRPRQRLPTVTVNKGKQKSKSRVPEKNRRNRKQMAAKGGAA